MVNDWPMSQEETVSFSTLKNTSRILHYEALISRPGVGEPDSRFILSSKFRAPMGISYVGDKMHFDLFLPEGSEDEPEKKLFLNRVGANLQDGVWHVRRSEDQVKELYGPALKFALSSFRTLFMDYSYVEKGRVYIHLMFNENDLPIVSKILLSLDTKSLDLRLEYLKKLGNEETAFKILKDSCDAASVTINIQRTGSLDAEESERVHFLMGTTLDEGVKTLALSDDAILPDILKPDNAEKIGKNVFTFFSTNEVVTGLMEMMFKDQVVFFGYHGYATENMMSISINLPKLLTTSLLKVLGKLGAQVRGYSIDLQEVVDFI